MKTKKIRIIAASFLLFQNCLLPSSVFAEEIQSTENTEIVEGLQQSANPIPDTSATIEESVVQEGVESTTPETTAPEVVEEVPPIETPPEASTSENTGEVPETPTTEGTENTPSTSTEAPPPIAENPAVPDYLKNINQRVYLTDALLAELRNHGQTSYIDDVLKKNVNRTLTLGGNVGDKVSFTVTVPTHSVVNGNGNDWIAQIGSDQPWPVAFYRHMYYGDHVSYPNNYSLNDIKSNAPAFLKVTATATSGSQKATITVTIERTAVNTATQSTIDLSANVNLGTTVVPGSDQPGGTIQKVRDVLYSNTNIGKLTINHEQPKPTATIKDNITIEAQRSAALTLDIVKSWFSQLPDKPDDYEYSYIRVSNPLAQTWAPNEIGTILVTLKHKTTGVSDYYETVYTVKDTQAPTATVKNSVIEFPARSSGSLTRDELLQFVEGDLKDNWSLPANIKIDLVNSNGNLLDVSQMATGQEHTAYIRLEDEAKNQSKLYEVKFKLKSLVTIKDEVTVEAKRSGSYSQDTIKSWFSQLPDKPDDYEYSYIKVSNPLSQTWAPNETGEIVVELKHKPSGALEYYNTKYTVKDTQAPTYSFAATQTLTFQARRTGEPTREELFPFFNGSLTDNWTEPNKIDISMSRNIAGISPGGTGAATFVVGDEAGNTSTTPSFVYKIVDTQAPTATVKNSVIEFPGRPSGSLTRDELLQFVEGDLKDNWSLPANIKINLVDSNGNLLDVSQMATGQEHTAYIRLEDEAKNQSKLYEVKFKLKSLVTIKDEVTVEAKRSGSYSQDTIKSWFSQLPDKPDDYEYSYIKVSNPLSQAWAPNETGDILVTLEHKTSGVSEYHNTKYIVKDTQAPTATVKNTVIEFPARSSGNLSRDELLQFVEGDLKDNWSLPDDIKIDLVDGNGTLLNVSQMSVNKEHEAYIRLEDEAKNQSKLYDVKFKLIDDEGPTGTVTTDTVDLEARRTGELTEAEIRQFLTSEPSDNITPSDKIKVTLVDGSGKDVSIAGVAPSATVIDAAIRLTDEGGNHTDLPVKYRIVDTEAPTGPAKGRWTVFEADRNGTFTQADLRSLFEKLEDNWTETEKIILTSGKSLSEMKPLNSNPSAYWPMDVTAEDEAGNKQKFTTMVRIEDTTAPEGKLKDPLIFTQGEAEPDPRQYLDGDPTDNWTLSDAIKVEVAYENDVQFADLTVGEHDVIVTLTDEVGNKQPLKSKVTILEDTSEFIDVTIPVKVSFAESKESGGIVSPLYQISNNADRTVKVSVNSVVSKSETEKLTEIDLGIKNNYNDNEVMLISSGQNLNNRRELGVIAGHSSSFSFSLFGTVGENFDFDNLNDPLHPIYNMQLNFNAQ
ncbi:hypothetical protein E1H99_04815 [Enterococcus hirae]|nr:hypothetical protein E1H99_04815 [Enterococcus hirae]